MRRSSDRALSFARWMRDWYLWSFIGGMVGRRVMVVDGGIVYAVVEVLMVDDLYVSLWLYNFYG